MIKNNPTHFVTNYPMSNLTHFGTGGPADNLWISVGNKNHRGKKKMK